MALRIFRRPRWLRWPNWLRGKRLLTVAGILLLILFIGGAIAGEEAIVGSAVMIAFVGTLAFLIVDRFVQKRKVRQLQEASLVAEVAALKSQINPHFFFNTLNNLYALTVDKSEDASQVVLKLSDMLRYTIYEGNKDKVLLTEEIGYLKNFIELHKIRFHKEVDVSFDSFVEDETCTVPPLLFVNLLENAFKHGAETLTGDAFVRVRLICMNKDVYFEVENNFDPEAEESSGIGLTNLERRLQLLFPDRHELTSGANGEANYKAVLKLQLQ